MNQYLHYLFNRLQNFIDQIAMGNKNLLGDKSVLGSTNGKWKVGIFPYIINDFHYISHQGDFRVRQGNMDFILYIWQQVFCQGVKFCTITTYVSHVPGLSKKFI